MTRRIPLRKGGKIVKWALVDDWFFPFASRHRWRLGTDGYAICDFAPKRRLTMQRLVMRSKLGYIIDHANGNKLDNRAANLRHATEHQNHINSRPRWNKKYKGVCYIKYKKPNWKHWRAQIKYRGRTYHLGQFTTEKEAALAYDQAAKKYFGKFAYQNLSKKP